MPVIIILTQTCFVLFNYDHFFTLPLDFFFFACISLSVLQEPLCEDILEFSGMICYMILELENLVNILSILSCKKVTIM